MYITTIEPDLYSNRLKQNFQVLVYYDIGHELIFMVWYCMIWHRGTNKIIWHCMWFLWNDIILNGIVWYHFANNKHKRLYTSFCIISSFDFFAQSQMTYEVETHSVYDFKNVDLRTPTKALFLFLLKTKIVYVWKDLMLHGSRIEKGAFRL